MLFFHIDVSDGCGGQGSLYLKEGRSAIIQLELMVTTATQHGPTNKGAYFNPPKNIPLELTIL